MITTKAKFEPESDKCLLFIGQDLRAVGGLPSYSDGYCDHFEMPAGVTVYTGFSPGTESYGYIQKGNDGLKSVANWGAEDNCAQFYIDNQKFNNTMISIGLAMVDHVDKVAGGLHDDLIKELGQWIKGAVRPVFLRIGYEFDGWSWNRYNKNMYLKAWSHIRNIFEKMGIENVAYVWQSKGHGSGQHILEEWYPGDDLVDWCGYSYFHNPDQEMLDFARKHNKPVFIAEATPLLTLNGRYDNTDLNIKEVAERTWKEWFKPFFSTIKENSDVIKAFSYINVDWKVQPMWENNPLFKHVDSRIQISEYVSKKWVEEISKDRYLKASSQLWDKLD